MYEVDVVTIDEHIEEIIDELLTGAGAVAIRGAFNEGQVSKARELIMEYSKDEDKETHFQGANEDTIHLQRRVWNLLAKGEIFESMVQHPDVVKITDAFLGNQFHLGSIAANRLLPGGPGQEPHIDYPYWDMYDREGFPARINSSYPLNLQVTIPLDPFNETSVEDSVLDSVATELQAEAITGELDLPVTEEDDEPNPSRALFFAAILSAVSILVGGLWFGRRRKKSEELAAASITDEESVDSLIASILESEDDG